MTNNEVKDTLKQASRLVNSMDKAHVKDLLLVLVDAQFGENCASFFNIDIKKTLKKMLSDLIKEEHVSERFNREQMKRIFEIMGNYIDIKKTLKKMLSDLIKEEHVSERFNRKQMKRIFEIMGDYKVYPVCKLCGMPIEINSAPMSHKEELKGTNFSWDHQVPKSKGGSYDLTNLQPTHKLCNNKRGSRPLYSRHYKIKMKMKIDIDIVVSVDGQNPRYRPTGFGLRKQDSWCHKQCCQKQR